MRKPEIDRKDAEGFTLHCWLPKAYQRKLRIMSANENQTIPDVLKSLIDSREIGREARA